MAELRTAQAIEDEKKKQDEAAAAAGGDDTETEGETVIETGAKSGSKEVEIGEKRGELIDRKGRSGSRSEISTEDEWERVSENEKDK